MASGLPMLDYVQLLVPGVLSLWSPQYLGLAGVLLVAVALWGWRQAPGPEIGFWAAVAVVAGWLALGDKGVLFELAYRVAPGFSLFQAQERLLGISSLAGALLAAQGLALWLRGQAQARLRVVLQAGASVAAGLLLAGLILVMAAGATSGPWPGVWLRQWAVLAVALGLLVGRRWPEGRALALAALAGADLYLSTLGAMRRQSGPPSAYWPQPAWLEALRTSSPARFDSSGLFYANVGEIYGLEDVHGLSPLKPQALVDLQSLPPARRWQLLNVTHVLASSPPEGAPLEPVAQVSEGLLPGVPLQATLYRFRAALPRAWLSYRPLRVAGRAAALERLRDPAFDPATEVVFHTDVEGVETVAPPPAGSVPPQVTVSRPRPGALAIQVETPTAAFLVLSEWGYPGWQATLDGQRVPLHPANYAFQAVWVPAGRHELAVQYAAPWEKQGMLLSLASLVGAGLLAWRWRPTVRAGQRERAAGAAAFALQAPPAPRGGWPWLCVATVWLGYALRAWRVGAQELRGDEAFSFLFARLPVDEIAPALLRQGDPHSPLHYWLLHGWMHLAGRSELALRFVSLVPGVLLLPLLYQVGRRLGRRRLGVVAAALGALSQSLVWIGQDVRNQYTLAMVTSTLAAILLVRALERPSWGRWVLYAASCTLTVYSHYYGAFALLAHGLLLLTVPAWRSRLWQWLASGVASLLTFLPWLVAIWPYLLRARQLQDPDRPELAHYLTTVGRELTAGSALSPGVGRWLFVGALALAAVGAGRLFRQRPGWAALLTGWLGAATLMIYLLRFSRATFNAFYVLVAAPAWWLLVAAGLEALWQWRPRWGRWLGTGALAALVVANGASLERYHTLPRYSRTTGYRELCAHLAAQAAPGDLLVANFPDPSLDYYLWDLPLPRTIAPPHFAATQEETERALSELAARYRRLWLVPVRGSRWDPQGYAEHWLNHHALLEQEAVAGNLTLLAYRPLAAAGQALAPLDLPLGGLLRLEGAHVTVNGSPARLDGGELGLPAGASLRVTLLWHAQAETSESYTVFVHLVGEDGRLVAQHDGTPVFGTCPTWTWKPGDRLLDRHDLTVPAGATGRGTLVVGLYHSQTLQRQCFADGRDAIPLAAVRLGGGG